MAVTGASRWLLIVVAAVALLLAMDSLRLFGGAQWSATWLPLEAHYYFALLGVLLPAVFVAFPRQRWLDTLLALVVLGACGFGVWNAQASADEGWEFVAPEHAVWVAFALWITLLEALRRAAGWGLLIIAALFSVLPVFADRLPGDFAGLATSWSDTAAYHVFSIESLFGLPFRAFAELVIGFLLFGVALQHTGGGRFFLDLAFAVLGRVRGGPAKVAILSSGLMGSMSGSVVTNVLTTGQLTIPAMRRTGFSGEVAGGVEACASTGGVLLPPIMGSTAFVMATFLEVPYFEVAAAAALPAVLYFLVLFLQIDGYAARLELQGAEETPSVIGTLKDGWYYVGAFVALVVFLIVLQREAVAPYYATALLLVLNQFSPEHRWHAEDFGHFMAAVGRLLAELVSVLAGVGLIVGALSVTGLSGTLVNDLLSIAGDELWLLVLMGAATSFVLGIGMTVTAAYIFLAIVLAPALQQSGFDPMAVHLFILYWAMLSFITPPVALGAFAAASVAESDPLRTGLAAMRLGGVIYLLPFVFLLQPSLVLQADGLLLPLLEALAGCWCMVGALQGYLLAFGRVDHMALRVALGIGGAALALPGLESVGLPVSNGGLLWLAAGLVVPTLLTIRLRAVR